MRHRVTTGSPYEDVAGYSRAIVDGNWIFVSGTVGQNYATGEMSDDPALQARQALRNIEHALEACSATLENVVRLRVYIADRNDFEAVCQEIGERFRKFKPANTTIVAQLVDPAMKVEIEATARRGSRD